MWKLDSDYRLAGIAGQIHVPPPERTALPGRVVAEIHAVRLGATRQHDYRQDTQDKRSLLSLVIEHNEAFSTVR
jgi:hypothetical protein